MKCPSCHTENKAGATECISCAVIFAHAKRALKPRADGPKLCAWNDHGMSCGSRGIVSLGTNGDGSWYCRQHWAALNGVSAEGSGNYPVEPTHSGNASRWDGWHAQWLASRDRRRLVAPQVPAGDGPGEKSV